MSSSTISPVTTGRTRGTLGDRPGIGEDEFVLGLAADLIVASATGAIRQTVRDRERGAQPPLSVASGAGAKFSADQLFDAVRHRCRAVQHRSSKDSIIEYETQVKAGTFVVVADGLPDEVSKTKGTLAATIHQGMKEHMPAAHRCPFTRTGSDENPS